MIKDEMTARVIYGDTDQAGVVYYANYLRWFEMGRTELLRDHGLTYRQLEEEGCILPVAELSCRYHASARYDDLLLIETEITANDRVSLTFTTRIRRQGEDKVLVEGTCRMVAVNKEGKLSRLPDKLLNIIKM